VLVRQVGLRSSAPFADAEAKFEEMKQTMASKDWEDATHDEIERYVLEHGRELMRRMVQAHLDLRSEAEAVGPVVGSDGVERTHRRAGTKRGLITRVGEVDVKRPSYGGRGVESLHPTDAALNLPDKAYSHELQRLAALNTAQVSFERAADLIAEATGVGVPKRQIEELTQTAALDVNAFYEARMAAPDTEASGPLLVLSFDQTGVVMRKKDLRPAARKQADKEPKLKTRLTKGEKKGRKRMASVAAVYTIEPDVRDADFVLAGLRRLKLKGVEGADTRRPRPERKRVTASLELSLREVVSNGFQEAERRDPQKVKRWVVVVDGDEKLSKAVRAEAKRRGVEVTLILDAIHVLQYLWRAGHALNDEASPELEAWVLERFKLVLQGNASTVAAGMRRSATKRGLDAQARKPIDKAANYILGHKGMMHYDEYLAAGLPIASGVIEGTCRSLVKDRTDITGARWSMSGAEAVLLLRAVMQSGDFNEYWEFHLDREYDRNHASRYAGAGVPQVCAPARRKHLRAIK